MITELKIMFYNLNTSDQFGGTVPRAALKKEALKEWTENKKEYMSKVYS